MCGITGVVDLRGHGRLPAPEILDRMTDALARRGPDGRGTWRNDNVALGHRRLAILDPTPAGAQPMVHRERGDVVITFNGEIYNFRELRAELEPHGHTFTTGTDTEVILAAWLQWGPRCVERMNGIFAFALVDGRRVFLARDPLGVKPLFYSITDGVLRFGSELKAILADPSVKRVPSRAAIDCFLTLSYVPHPLTPFEGVSQLPPATSLEAEIGSDSLRERRYWRPSVAERQLSLERALEELRGRLAECVVRQMVSDVPLGAFLSGGLDSASVVGEMVRVSGEVRTFSIGFASQSFDERKDAAESARILGTRHRAEEIELDLRASILDVAETNDDLLADSSLIAVDKLCKMTREEVTVALSGDGADELLAGYDTYAATYLARVWRNVPGPLRAMVRAAVERLPVTTARYNKRDFAKRFLSGAERGPGRDFGSWRIYLDEADKRALLKRDAHTGADVKDADPIGRYAAYLDEIEDATLLKRMLVADISFYLPNDMLAKVDRASMRHGLEVRVPFLDPTFVDFALSLPSHLLLSRTGEKKRLLRRHVEQRLSRETATRKKRGFNVPIADAFKGPLHDLLLDALKTEPFRSSGPLDVDAVERHARRHREGKVDAGFGLYALLTLALWWNRFIA